MIVSIIFNYFFALAIERRGSKKVFLSAAVIFNLSLLFVFKYLNFSVSIFASIFHLDVDIIPIVLPIGISFFTFQAMSYIIDVYRGDAKAQRNIRDLGLYISLFPQLIAGPIVRYNSIATQIEDRQVSPELFGAGSKRFIAGLCKKVLIANNVAIVADYFFGQSASGNSIAGAWLGAVSFALQIFFDFSGYSDMAIGLGKMFGFHFEENFNYPYISKSITEFWRRWHISLGKWFRDYVYIPLGGSRVSIPRHIINMGIVWILTGIWHGASYSFIVWGLMYFAALVLEKYIIKPSGRKSTLFGSIYQSLVLIYILFAWVIFKADGLENGIRYCLSMIGVYYHNNLVDAHFIHMVKEYGAFLLAAVAFSTPIAAIVSNRVKDKKLVFVEKYIVPAIYLVGLLWSVSFMILGAHNPFIYFNF